MVQSWGQLDAAKAQIEATTAQVNAAEIALNGVREEARVGQRTTLDVLNAQQELVNARVALVTAQHDRVVASYTLLAAVGGLSMQHSASTSRSTIRRCITSKSAMPGSACAAPTADSASKTWSRRPNAWRSTAFAAFAAVLTVFHRSPLPAIFAMTYSPAQLHSCDA